MRESRKVRRLRGQITLAANYIASQEETMIVLREELRDYKDANTHLRAELAAIKEAGRD